MKSIILKISLQSVLLLICVFFLAAQNPNFVNGVGTWKDNIGNPINAHGGGILYHEGTYYWYGEIKKGQTWLLPGQGWECYRVPAGGVSCYSSKDLINWKNEGVVLAATTGNNSSDLDTSKVIERPKVIYNAQTKKFVMWMHVDTKDYAFARAGVAVCDKPNGTFTYIGSFRPNGQMSRDQTIFMDDNGKAYQISSMEDNATMYVNELTSDFLKPTGRFKRNLVGLGREAPAIVKHNKRYYLISSASTGWAPNMAEYAVSDSIMGVFKMVGNPCIGRDADKTFNSQSTYILPLVGKNNSYIAMFDCWNKSNLEDSKYVWLPLKFVESKMVIEWKNEWKNE